VLDGDFPLRLFRQQGFECGGVERLADQDAGRNGVVEIVLGDEGFERFGRCGALAVLGKEAAVAEGDGRRAPWGD